MSATVGIKGLSVNIGQNGTYLNTGMPGTGIYDRTRLDNKASNAFVSQNNSIQNYQISAENEAVEIQSFQPELLTSEGLFGLKESIVKARKIKKELKEESKKANNKKNTSLFLAIVAHLFVFGIFIKWFREKYKSAKADAKEAVQTYKNFKMDIDFNMDSSMLNEYTTLKNNFEKLTTSHKIWDVTSTQAIDRVKMRSSASKLVEKIPVRFLMGSLDYINTKHGAFKLQNANGGDLYIYPAFIVIPSKYNDNFAIIDFRDIKLEHYGQRFVENDSVPSDAEIIDHTWQYVNKNGSPDKRYSYNPQIPIARYYSITLESKKGLHERFYISNADYAKAFCTAFDKYCDSMTKMKWEREEVDDELVQTQPLPFEHLSEEKPDEANIKEHIIRELKSGIIPEVDFVNSDLPIRLKYDNEKVMFLFKSVLYRKKLFLGGTEFGKSYLDKDYFYAMPKLDANEKYERGDLYVTNKSFYFFNGRSTVDSPHFSISTIKVYSNGIAVFDDIFIVSDVWFIYNLMHFLGKLAMGTYSGNDMKIISKGREVRAKKKEKSSPKRTKNVLLNEDDTMHEAQGRQGSKNFDLVLDTCTGETVLKKLPISRDELVKRIRKELSSDELALLHLANSDIIHRLSSHDDPYYFLSSAIRQIHSVDNFSMCEKLFGVIDEYASMTDDLSFLHFYYMHKMEVYYRNRDVIQGAFDKAMENIGKMIEVAAEFSKSNSKERVQDNPSHPGYKQLAIIFFKQKKFKEVIEVCQQAKSQYWKGDWDDRIEKAKAKLEKVNI